MSQTNEISFTAVFITENTEEVVEIIKSLQDSNIAKDSDEYNININITANNTSEES